MAIWHEHQGLSADAIVAQFPQLTLGDVHAALAYYYDHIDAIREEIRSDEATAEHYKAASGASVLKQRLRRRKRAS